MSRLPDQPDDLRWDPFDESLKEQSSSGVETAP